MVDPKIIEMAIRYLSHEIKNPLTTIKGYAQLLDMDQTREAVREKSRKIIIEQINRIDDMLRELYDLFMLRIDHISNFNLNVCIDDIINNPECNDGIHIENNINDDKFSIEADRDLFKRLLNSVICGIDWDNNKNIIISIEVHSENSAESIRFIFKGADLGDYDEKTFFLPYASKKIYMRGTELYEAYLIAHVHNWTFTMLNENNMVGFEIQF